MARRSEEHTSELQSHHPISYAVFCLKKKKIPNDLPYTIDLQLEQISTSPTLLREYFQSGFIKLPYFFFNDTATTEIYTGWYTLSLHDALPISERCHAASSQTRGPDASDWCS